MDKHCWKCRFDRIMSRLVSQAALLCLLGGLLACGQAMAAETAKLAIAPDAAILPTPPKVEKRDADGHGLLCSFQGKRILLLAGTPAQMGAAHGRLLAADIREMAQMRTYLVGAGYSLEKGDWFFTRMEEVKKRTEPHTPPRFLEECDAMSVAAGISVRDGRNANFFPEMFHCSGVALRGKATVGGKVLHARVLDYMKDINVQKHATVTLFMPEGYNTWLSLGYASFVGTVTAMNEHGLAVGEMGGRGEGNWDGLPMSLLLRDIMERAKNVQEALKILRETPRTCEYYYVISDKSGDLAACYCTPEKMEVLLPGQQDPRLPQVPEDTVFISGPGERANTLSARLRENYGKIDAQMLREIIKRPVAMNSNLHDAIFAPEDLDMWVADAGKTELACDMPYVKVNLTKLRAFYQENIAEKQTQP